MSIEKQEITAEGELEKDELPLNNLKPEEVIPAPEFKVEDPLETKPEEIATEKPVETKPKETEKPAEKPEETNVEKPENLESDDTLPWTKQESVKEETETEKETVLEELNPEEIFNPELIQETTTETVEEKEVEVTADERLNALLTEVKEVVGIELPTDPKEAAKTIQTAIAQAKTVTEIDKSKYTAEQIALHNHLQSEKGLQEFVDLTAPFVNFLSKPEEEKVRLFLVHEKGMKDDDAIQVEMDRLIDADEWDKTVEDINSGIIALRDKEVNNRITKLAADYTTLSQRETEIVTSERNELIAAIDELTDFMGMKIPDTFKAKLKSEISSGHITKMNNNAKTQINARLYDLVGATIIQQNKSYIEKIRDDAYNRGFEKGRGSLHNTPVKQESLGRQTPEHPQETEQKGFKDIDKDAKTT